MTLFEDVDEFCAQQNRQVTFLFAIPVKKILWCLLWCLFFQKMHDKYQQSVHFNPSGLFLAPPAVRYEF